MMECPCKYFINSVAYCDAFGGACAGEDKCPCLDKITMNNSQKKGKQ